jgi:hypothetical protein
MFDEFLLYSDSFQDLLEGTGEVFGDVETETLPQG